MDNNKVRESFGKEIKNARKTVFPYGNQQKLADKINSKLPTYIDFKVSQEMISKIENGKNIFLPDEVIENLVQICRDNGYAIEETLANDFIEVVRTSKENKKRRNLVVSFSEFENVVSNPKQEIFETYFGTYNCLFHSTDSSDPKCIKGIMRISPDLQTHQCKVEFSILENGQIIKKYDGVFLINKHYDMWYCILVGKKKQEICMIASQHFNSSMHNNLFNIALVITTSAGVKKRPTMHRMFIARDTEQLDENKIELILTQLKLNDDTIFISEKNLEALKNDIENRIKKSVDKNENIKYRAVIKCIDQIRKQPCEKYYRIDESILYDSSIISKNKDICSYAVSQLRKYTDNKYYNKLSDTVHEICTNIMKKL